MGFLVIQTQVMNPKVDVYLNEEGQWQAELRLLRKILLDCQLTEELKWGKPCYSYNGKNILILYTLKDFCGPGFFKGALLKDTEGILVKPGANSQASRYIKFTDTAQILEMAPVLKAYVYEALEVEKAGLKVDFDAINKLEFSAELQHKFDENPRLKKAFHALTPGRQRGYHLYFSAAKRSETRMSRIEKYIPRILDGYGFHDCVCGRSKRMPTCDGSHKHIS